LWPTIAKGRHSHSNRNHNRNPNYGGPWLWRPWLAMGL